MIDLTTYTDFLMKETVYFDYGGDEQCIVYLEDFHFEEAF